jgi:hypothetical protein
MQRDAIRHLPLMKPTWIGITRCYIKPNTKTNGVNQVKLRNTACRGSDGDTKAYTMSMRQGVEYTKQLLGLVCRAILVYGDMMDVMVSQTRKRARISREYIKRIVHVNDEEIFVLV